MKTVYVTLFALWEKVERNHTKMIVFPIALLYIYIILNNLKI